VIPDRYRAMIERLSSIAAEHEGPVGRLAEELSSFVTDVAWSSLEDDDRGVLFESIERPGSRISTLAASVERLARMATTTALDVRKVGAKLAELEARVRVLELALTETNRRIPAGDELPEPTSTVFGIPVVLTPGTTADNVRDAVAELPPGLDARGALGRLVAAGLVIEARA
jgi:hypothetical protein